MTTAAMTVHRGEVVDEQPAGGALAAVSRESGVMALAMMGEAEFEGRLEALKLGQDRVRRIQRELMIGPTQDNPEGEDYGVIPGTKKPTLLKPGAEKICQVYGLVPVFEETWIEGDGVTTPHLRVRIKCRLHRGSAEGPVAGEGAGAANSWEKKHRYRGAQRSCPACGCEGTIKRSSFERDGDKGWYCHAKVGGCGASFHSADQSITDQQGGQVNNPDPYDVENTLLKMAAKRAQVDATLRVTATSGLFTQDLEDQAPDDGRPTAPAADPAPPTATPTPAAQTRPAATPAPAQRRAGPPSTPKASAAPAQTAGAQPNGRWQGPCPRCKTEGAVIQNKRDGHGWYCWPNASRAKGCGYKWDAADVEVHQAAQAEREQSGEMFEDRVPGLEG